MIGLPAGVIGFILAKREVDKNRLKQLRVRQRMKRSNEGEYEGNRYRNTDTAKLDWWWKSTRGVATATQKWLNWTDDESRKGTTDSQSNWIYDDCSENAMVWEWTVWMQPTLLGMLSQQKNKQLNLFVPYVWCSKSDILNGLNGDIKPLFDKKSKNKTMCVY